MKRLNGIFAGLALIGLTIFGTASPATAHANETSSSPAAGAIVEAGAIPVEINFGEALMNLGQDQGNVVEIQAPDGVLVPTPCWTTLGTGSTTELSTTAQLAVEGKYVVHWRVVSADGHPVEGLFDFKVKNTGGFVVDPNVAACGADVGPVESPMPISAPIASPYDSANSAVNDFNWIVVGDIGAAAIGLLTRLVLRRKRKSE